MELNNPSTCSLLFNLFVLYLAIFDKCHCLQDITSVVFPDSTPAGTISAFGDFNSDKLTDVFIVKDKGKTLEILLASYKEPLLRHAKLNCTLPGDLVITSLVPGDYDGDSMMDVLITYRPSGQAKNDYTTKFSVLWGNMKSLNCSLQNTTGELRDQPLVLDSDGNRIPDLFGETMDGNRTYWHMNRTLGVLNYTIHYEGGNRLKVPHSHAFIDLNHDMSTDMVVMTDNYYEIHYSTHGELKYNMSIPIPNGTFIVGQSTFVDIDLDGTIDHLVPVCYKDCKNSSILIYKDKHWIPFLTTFQDGHTSWGFIPNAEPITLRMGDYNMDGYPDALIVLKELNTNQETYRAFILENIPCNKQGLFHRTFSVMWDIDPLNHMNNVTIASFYDIYADGIMDVIVVQDNGGQSVMSALLNEFSNDACFIKVMVLSGLCYTDCDNNGIKPFGANQPGPTACYRTTTTNGERQVSCAGQLSQSAYNALQMPYIVFGLGQTPNFVDQLEVGIPNSRFKENRTHEWTSIIPNSQMIVVPELKNSNTWLFKMYVTPSHLAIKTFIALVSTCVMIGLIIGALHWKERRADRRERLQESHRFHFDAM